MKDTMHGTRLPLPQGGEGGVRGFGLRANTRIQYPLILSFSPLGRRDEARRPANFLRRRFALLLPARGEKVGTRGPLRRARSRKQYLQRCRADRSAQNRGEAPSPSVASRPRPLPAQRGEVERSQP
jgi:hypothetical protein